MQNAKCKMQNAKLNGLRRNFNFKKRIQDFIVLNPFCFFTYIK